MLSSLSQSPQGMHPSALTVSRTSDDDFKERQLVIWIDGDKVRELMFGEVFSRNVAPGKHALRVSNTLVWKTVKFEAKPGEEVRFEVVNRAGLADLPDAPHAGSRPALSHRQSDLVEAYRRQP